MGDYARRDFRVYCLTDSGTFSIMLSATGYTARSVNVRCVPSVLYIGKTDIPVEVTRESPPRGHGGVSIAPAALDPDTMQVLQVQILRGGLDPGSIAIANP